MAGAIVFVGTLDQGAATAEPAEATDRVVVKTTTHVAPAAVVSATLITGGENAGTYSVKG